MVDRLAPSGWLNFQDFLSGRVAEGKIGFESLLESVNRHVEDLKNQGVIKDAEILENERLSK